MNIGLQKLIDLALRKGASHAEVYQSNLKSDSIFFETNDLKRLENSQSEGIALRLWKEGASGLAVAYGEFDNDKLVDNAIALSTLNSNETIELNSLYVNLQSHQGEFISIEQLIKSGKDTISRLRNIYTESICNGEFTYLEQSTCLVNSLGLHCEYSKSSVNYYIELELAKGKESINVYDTKVNQEKIETQQIVKNILQRLKWGEKTILAPKGYVPTLFTPNGASMLWNTVSEALNSKFVLEKTSPWSNKIGKQVISSSLTLSQQPRYRSYVVPFDDEGIVTQELSLIKKGNLEQFYSNLTNAKILGTKSTGNGFRPNLRSYPTPILVNLIVESGKEDFKSLIKVLDRGIIVDSVLGGKIDISGDFSINVNLGYSVHNGLIDGKIKNSIITGNVYKILENTIEIANDSCWINSICTPSILVEGLSIIT